MLRLLTIEFHKLKYNNASKILSIIYFGLLTSIALIAAIKFEFGDFKLHLADAGIFNFPYIWHFNTYIASESIFSKNGNVSLYFLSLKSWFIFN